MVEKLATNLISQMIENKIIDKEMKERYIYTFICFVEKFITIGSIMLISLITNNFLPTIFFLIFFFELRKRTGGYHLDKFYKCYLATVASCLIVMVIGTNLVEHIQILLGILAIATVYIEIVGTVNHPNMQMNSTELAESKKIARIVVLLECSIIFGCVL
ncbi:MAG: accessory gene regulator B family protein, partial [Treponema sp.]